MASGQATETLRLGGGAVVDRATPKPGRSSTTSSDRWFGLAFVTPLVLYLVLFYLYPLIRNVDLSIHDYNVRAFMQGNADFVGWSNHLAVLQSSAFRTALVNTLFFTVVSILFQYSLGLALAVFFTKHFPLSTLLRGLFLIPWLLPLIVSGSIWSWMMNSDYGVINSLISLLGGTPVNWLTSPTLVLVSVTIANIWLGIPFNLVILYSGLQNISEDLYEAASLDGANSWQQFWRITVPLLRPVSAITLMLGFVYTLKVVDIIWIMTKGGPGNSSLTLAVMSYRNAFGTGQPDFSTASAIGNLLIVLALAVGILYLNVQRRQEQ
ncbi:MAG: sugar ABC transporter permease [Actinomyces sp.]|jgi:multiple sugar transport system permease protein|nr:sugar ABC transporter permease [Actinomyces sp.]MCI1788219.1 sugar ABC transporter permease [Actinomyces sp.]MCI1830051.1 sugar ABC transporter permease [Actinomyces sp.]MCI1866490.1 sugar ABC transporter permease [Actinomyces sp.]